MMKIIVLFALALAGIAPLYAQDCYGGKSGFALSPAGFPDDYSRLGEFMQETAALCGGGVIYANALWRDSFESGGRIPLVQKLVSTQQLSYGYVDMINFGWRSGESLFLNVPENAVNNWTNDAAKKVFLRMLVNAADSLRPAFFFIGNEVDFYWQQDSTDFLNWVDFYHQAYDSIKAHSPESRVGTVFNYEHLSGSGVLTGFEKSHWGALDAFNPAKVDIWGVTLYPFFSFRTAVEISDDYLEPLFARIGDKPFAVTETGWPADSLIGSWSSSPLQQVDYVHRLFQLLQGRAVEAVNWLFLNYMMDRSGSVESRIFRSVALRDSLGNDRPALKVFKSFCARTSVAFLPNRPGKLILSQNYPNPFNPSTTIPFQVKEPGHVFLNVYDIGGREVTTLIDEDYQPGHYKLVLQSDNWPSGVYFFSLRMGSSIIVRKMIRLE